MENKKRMNEETNLQETSMSTQSGGSRMSDQLLGREAYSKADIEQFQWIDIANTPFRAVGKPGAYTLVLANMAVCGKSFRTVADAERYVKKKTWDLILIATKIYSELIENKKRELENGNN